MVVERGERPKRPVEVETREQGLSDEMWALIEACWSTHPNERPCAKPIAARIAECREAHKMSTLSAPQKGASLFGSCCRSQLERTRPLAPLEDHSDVVSFLNTDTGEDLPSYTTHNVHKIPGAPQLHFVALPPVKLIEHGRPSPATYSSRTDYPHSSSNPQLLPMPVAEERGRPRRGHSTAQKQSPINYVSSGHRAKIEEGTRPSAFRKTARGVPGLLAIERSPFLAESPAPRKADTGQSMITGISQKRSLGLPSSISVSHSSSQESNSIPGLTPPLWYTTPRSHSASPGIGSLPRENPPRSKPPSRFRSASPSRPLHSPSPPSSPSQSLSPPPSPKSPFLSVSPPCLSFASSAPSVRPVMAWKFPSSSHVDSSRPAEPAQQREARARPPVHSQSSEPLPQPFNTNVLSPYPLQRSRSADHKRTSSAPQVSGAPNFGKADSVQAVFESPQRRRYRELLAENLKLFEKRDKRETMKGIEVS